ncbi:MAG: hypothetical protein GF364_08470 [Candidatus Lokiarchaeota archaeon]|nr:hypothetical protein [Candidatus Lokiarchaeota archaeon]
MCASQEERFHERHFNKKLYIADLELKFDNKDDARNLMHFLKDKDSDVRARVVKRNGTIYIYFRKDTHDKIQSGELTLPPETKIDEFAEKKKSKRRSKRKSSRKPKKTGKKKSRKKKTKGKKSKKREKSKRTTVETPERYYETIKDVPSYLMDRVDRDVQRIMKLGVLEIERMPKKVLQDSVDLLRAAQINYDIRIQKEKEIIEFMNETAQAMQDRVVRYQEDEAKDYIQKYVREPMGKGKFDKYLETLEDKGLDEVSYLVFKKIGRKTKKYPFGDTHLIKKIKDVIEKRIK